MVHRAALILIFACTSLGGCTSGKQWVADTPDPSGTVSHRSGSESALTQSALEEDALWRDPSAREHRPRITQVTSLGISNLPPRTAKETAAPLPSSPAQQSPAPTPIVVNNYANAGAIAVSGSPRLFPTQRQTTRRRRGLTQIQGQPPTSSAPPAAAPLTKSKKSKGARYHAPIRTHLSHK